MATFSLAEILKATGGSIVKEGSKKICTSVSIDSRKIEQDSLFIAIKGENFDGHKFTKKAAEQGAVAVLVSDEKVIVNDDTTIILVKTDTLDALQKLARYHRLRFNIPVVSITGSNGKTTTKDLVASLLKEKFNVLKTIGNQNNEIGLPLTLLNITEEHQIVVTEFGMRGKGQIKELAEIAMPNLAIITNVGDTHIELLGSKENIASAKSELVEAINKDGTVFLNADDELVKEMTKQTKAKVVLFGINSKDADLKAENIAYDTETLHTSFDIRTKTETFNITMPLLGVHNVYNALAAISLAKELNLNNNDIQRGFLKDINHTKMRQEISSKGTITIINDTYNASPASMKAALETLSLLNTGRKIAVLGDMLELGENSIKYHQEIGTLVYENNIDILVTLGPLAENIAQKASSLGLKNIYKCVAHEDAKKILIDIIKPYDNILFKGSRGMQMEKIIEMINFELIK
ncbi:UDP-N-acetylmuramoyl-tripeptide--D-alanyl-D-alanine ligase [Selenomonadales bacterium OttesenSCG-928-I06]|nr:UDP-N-acetylmuramoyl-tripeptide--D-alanyl-D-alanine ligase [Selenomonadales bacterium OttesenSCG-928-I06]